MLHEELKRVMKEADVYSLSLDKQFLAVCVEELETCHDAPAIEEVKRRDEMKQRMRLDNRSPELPLSSPESPSKGVVKEICLTLR